MKIFKELKELKKPIIVGVIAALIANFILNLVTPIPALIIKFWNDTTFELWNNIVVLFNDILELSVINIIALTIGAGAFIWNMKKRKPVEIKRDIHLLNALHYIAFGSWDLQNLDSETPGADSFISALNKAAVAVRQAGRDGDLPVWGSDSRNTPLEPIDPLFWQHNGIENWEMLKDDPHKLRTEVKEGRQGAVFSDLMTCKTKVEELWPEPILSKK